MFGFKPRWIDDEDDDYALFKPAQAHRPSGPTPNRPAPATGLLTEPNKAFDDAMRERIAWTDPYPESKIHPAFRNALHQHESPNKGYAAFNPEGTLVRTAFIAIRIFSIAV